MSSLPLICFFCEDPLDETEVGVVSEVQAIVVCQDCVAADKDEGWDPS